MNPPPSLVLSTPKAEVISQYYVNYPHLSDNSYLLADLLVMPGGFIHSYLLPIEIHASRIQIK